MKKNNRKVLILIGSLAALFAVYFIADHILYVSTDNAQVEGHVVMVTSKVSGFVVKSEIFEGQKVKKDDVLIEIDSRDFQNSVQQMSGEFSSAEARKIEAESSFKRTQGLFNKGVVTQQQFDLASATYTEAKAKLESVSAQLAQAKLNLENTKIRAPSDGYIARTSVAIGQLASPGSPLIGFVDAHDRWISANFKETDLDKIHIGAPVKISVDALDGKHYAGKVETISPATGSTFTLLPPDNATGNFTKVVQRIPVRIQLDQLSDEQLQELRVGLSAYVKVSVR